MGVEADMEFASEVRLKGIGGDSPEDDALTIEAELNEKNQGCTILIPQEKRNYLFKKMKQSKK